MDCSICIEPLHGKTITTKCGHTYHSKCLAQWYESNDNCPYCRQSIEQYLINIYDYLNIKYYVFKNYKRKTIKIDIDSNNLDVSFI